MPGNTVLPENCSIQRILTKDKKKIHYFFKFVTIIGGASCLMPLLPGPEKADAVYWDGS
jgi:hypothetical protein